MFSNVYHPAPRGGCGLWSRVEARISEPASPPDQPATPSHPRPVLAWSNSTPNERDAKFAKLREVYFNEDADEKIGLTDSGLWQRLASFRSVHHNKAWSDVPTSQKLSSEVESDEDVTTVYSRGDEIYEVVMQAHSDPNVWPRLNKLCDNFLKQTSVPTMAVILSIL